MNVVFLRTKHWVVSGGTVISAYVQAVELATAV